jgi:hypothetical protein
MTRASLVWVSVLVGLGVFGTLGIVRLGPSSDRNRQPGVKADDGPEARPVQDGRWRRSASTAPAPGGVRGDSIALGPALDVRVWDVTGGAIGGAQLWMEGRPLGTTDAQGRLRLLAAHLPAVGELRAEADGYAPASTRFAAPGTVALRLHPQSTVDGLVVRAGDGAPVAQVVVSAGSVQSTSDASGRFSLRGLEPGIHTLEARSERWVGRAPASLALGMGRSEHGVRIEVAAAVVVHGRVTSAGRPFPPGKVSVALGESVSAPDAEGRFRLAGILPGRHRLRVVGLADAADQLQRTVDVGDSDVEVNIDLAAAHTVEVVVVDERDRPLPDVRVEARAPRGGTVTTVRCWTDATGRCRIAGLSAGALHGLGPEGGPRLDLEVPGADRAPVRFVLPGQGGLQGTLTTASARPAAGRMLEVRASDPASRLRKAAQTDAEGNFAFEQLPEGRYLLAVRGGATPDATLNAALPSPDPPELQVSVGVSAGETRRIALRLPAATGVLEGTVLEAGGQPAADVVVTYWPAHAIGPWQPFRSGLETVVTDQSGHFSFSHVPASGKFRVTAYRATGEMIASPPVAPDAGRLQLQLASVGQLEVHLDSESADPPSLLVEVSAAGATLAQRSCPAGRCAVTFEALPAGTPLEVAARSGARRVSQTTTLAPMRTSALALSLRAR